MAKRIEIALTNTAYRGLEELAGQADLRPSEVVRWSLRRVLADPDNFLAWLNGGAANARRQEHAA